jgi:hypothetical protein
MILPAREDLLKEDLPEEDLPYNSKSHPGKEDLPRRNYRTNGQLFTNARVVLGHCRYHLSHRERMLAKASWQG